MKLQANNFILPWSISFNQLINPLVTEILLCVYVCVTSVVCGVMLVRLKVVCCADFYRYHHAVFIHYRNFSYPWSIPNFLVLCAINSHFGEPTTAACPSSATTFPPDRVCSSQNYAYRRNTVCIYIYLLYSIHQS